MKRPVYTRRLYQQKTQRKREKQVTYQQIWDELPQLQRREMILALANMLVKQLPAIRQTSGGQSEQPA